MRAKQVLNVVPCKTKVRLVYERFTVTPVATAFVFLALAHCIVQISLQAIAYSANTAAGRTVSQILRESNVSPVFALVEDGVLKICSDPADLSACHATTSVPVTASSQTLARSDISIATSTGAFRRDVNLSELTVQCIEALNWPNMKLIDARREDICFLIFQVWLLGISIVAILNESIPHLVAGLVTHALSSVWSAFTVSRTQSYGATYKALVVRDACGGVNVLSGFWGKRLDYFVPILVLNSVAFAMASFVSYRLFKVYASQTFKRVGYSDKMNGLYSYVLLFSVALQLSAFLVTCASALQLDALFNGVLSRSVTNKTTYRIIFVHVCVWTLPWICIGWTSFRKENRVWSAVFLIIGLTMLGAWISVFPTTAYERRLQSSPFFATVTVTAFVVLTSTILLAVLCGLNFGKGLPQYLKSQDLMDEPIFVPVALTRKRRSALTSIVEVGEPAANAGCDVSSHPRDEKLTSENAVPIDAPPSYSLVVPYVTTPEQSFVLKTERNVLKKQQHRHGSVLHSSMGRRFPSADLTAIPEKAHLVDRTCTAVHSFTHALHLAQPEQLSPTSEHDPLLNTWYASEGMIDTVLPSRASTPLPLWRCERGSSWTSTPSSYSHLDERNVSGVAGSPRSNLSCSFSISNSSSPASNTPLHLPLAVPSTSERLTSPIPHSSGRVVPTPTSSGRLGLPPSPNCLKHATDAAYPVVQRSYCID